MIRLQFKAFRDYVRNNTTVRTRSRSGEPRIINMKIVPGKIEALVSGTGTYVVDIAHNVSEVLVTECSCPYSGEGICKHVVAVMVAADLEMAGHVDQNSLQPVRINNHYVLEGVDVLSLSRDQITGFSAPEVERRWFSDEMQLSAAVFAPGSLHAEISDFGERGEKTEIIQRPGELLLSCSCRNKSEHRVCGHLRFTLLEISRGGDLSLPFDTEKRLAVLGRKAAALGLRDLEDPDDFFRCGVERGRLFIEPKVSVLPLDDRSMLSMRRQLFQEFRLPERAPLTREILVITENRYEDKLHIRLMRAALTKSGELKSPIVPVSLKERLSGTTDHAQLRFYLALQQQDIYEKDTEPEDLLRTDLGFLRNIVGNSGEYAVYLQEPESASGKITPKNLEKIALRSVHTEAVINIDERNDFYVLTCSVTLDNFRTDVRFLKLRSSYFVRKGEELLLIDQPSVLRVMRFFRENKGEVFIHRSKFETFRDAFLNRLEQVVTVRYSYVQSAPPAMIREQQLDTITERMIYLSESDDYILITPVMRYGETEIPVLSRRVMYAINPIGETYSVERNTTEEARFVRMLQSFHPEFEPQEHADFFYLHKQEFLDENWFIDTFEAWRREGFTILGFNQIRGNRYNPNKMTVHTQVLSGIDWFDVHTAVAFGSQEVRLKEIRKAVLNKNRYVQLDDGTLGIIPETWLEQFGGYFRLGEIAEERIRVHKSKFQLIDELFEREVLTEEAAQNIAVLQEKLRTFHQIDRVEVPRRLRAELRNYQKEGLNWLSFLGEFGFGGCLADDMGLGKTVQMLAYFLLQIERGNTDPNLVVLPTSLLFNWEREIAKFAPDLRFKSIYGPNRKTSAVKFDRYDVFLTTYGTLISDISVLKEVRFNCIVLDESQAIKNPGSQRYKSVRLLKGNQRFVLTGTPVENNTFDLYAQLSFVMPGFLGSVRRFSEDYSIPIDRFQDTQRARELQQKIHPFVLRRTKKQVAQELPEKTEMVIFCEMGKEQRRIYDTYKREFQRFLTNADEGQLGETNMHILQGLMKLRQVCNSPALLSDDGYFGAESAKLEELMAQIDRLKVAHKILVFSQFTGMLDLIGKSLEQAGVSYALLTGRTRDRESVVNAFREKEDLRVFLISLKAGGTGLNLTEADYVFLVDPWWNPAVENQAIDRAYRIGQEKKVVAVRFITPGTIEEKIMELQQRKQVLAHDLIHTDLNVMKQLSREELMALL